MKPLGRLLTFAAFGVLTTPALGADTCDSPPPADTRPQELYHQLPLHFEANEGQTNPAVRYLARGSGYALFLTPQEAVLALRAPARTGKDPLAEVLRFRLKGANPSPTIEGEQRLEGKANYLIGNDPSRWRTDIPLYGRVRLGEVYPGVSLTYYGNQRELEYDFVVAPGADPRAIRFRVEGARSLRLDGEGNLVIRARRGELVQKAPVVYQVRDGVREPVPGRFRLRGKREIAFDVPSYDRSLALVIDPTVRWSVYLGGNSADSAEAVAVVDRGANTVDTYVTGSTFSTNFPVTGSFLGANQGGEDAFVTRFRYTTAPTLALNYSTYFGGMGNDSGRGIAATPADEAYITGTTSSGNFLRTVGPPALQGSSDAFVTRLNQTGTGLVYSRYLGGSGLDIGHDIAVDAQNNAYVVGETQSANFPVTGAPSPPFPQGAQGQVDAFFTALGPNGSNTGDTSPFAHYSTYLGGNQDDLAFGVSLRDSSPSFVGVQVVGQTKSTNFPTKVPLQAALRPPSDAFVTEFGGYLSSFSQSFGTFLGGDGDETAFAVHTVGSGPFDGIYVVGQTSADNFPTLGALQPTRRGNFDAFVTRMRLTGSPLVYSTYLGGALFDSASGVAVDGKGFAYVTGTTSSTNFPLVRELQSTLRGTKDAFLSKIVPTGCSLMYSTFWGGSGDEEGLDIAVTTSGPFGPSGMPVIVGKTSSSDFPPMTVGLPPLTFGQFRGGATDGFVTQISDDAIGDVVVTKVDSPDPVLLGQTLTYTLNVRNASTTAPAYGITLTDTLHPGVTFLSVNPPANCSFGGGTVTCDFPCLAPSPGPGDSVDVVITVRPDVVGPIDNSANVTTQDPDEPIGGNSVGPVTTTVLAAANLRVTKTSSAPPIFVNDVFSYSLNVTNNGPSNATNVQVVDTLPVGVTYIGHTGATCNPPPSSTVTCTIPFIAASTTFGPIQISVRATAAGLLTNQVTVGGNPESDPDPTDNTATVNTAVQVPGFAVRHFTVRSKGDTGPSNGENLLEWVTPAGPAANLRISRTVAAPGTPCVYETNPTVNEIHVRSFSASTYEFFFDTALDNDKTYCYTIFVTGGGADASGSPRFNSGRPFDAVTDRVRWANNLGTWSMTPVGNGRGVVHMVAQDSVLYSLVKGPTGGSWPGPLSPPSVPAFPLQWTPFGFMSQPAQGRPGTIPIPLGPANSVVFLSSQDGRVYAIDAEEGGTNPGPWTSSVLGTKLIGHVSGMFSAFGGATDAVVVGSAEDNTMMVESAFYALRLSDGAFSVPGWKQDGGPPLYPNGKIGPILGQAAVDYGTNPPHVYFATRAFGAAPHNNTLWCLNLLTGAVIWARPYGDISAGVTMRGNRLYIATDNPRTVQAIDKMTGNVAWTISGAFPIMPASEGPAKGFIYARNGPAAGDTELYFATKSRIWKLTDRASNPTEFLDNWPNGVPMDSPSTPIALNGDVYVYVGSGDGSLHRRDVTTGLPVDSFALGDQTPGLLATVGSPTFDLRGNYIYVTTDAGIVYAIEMP